MPFCLHDGHFFSLDRCRFCNKYSFDRANKVQVQASFFPLFLSSLLFPFFLSEASFLPRSDLLSLSLPSLSFFFNPLLPSPTDRHATSRILFHISSLRPFLPKQKACSPPPISKRRPWGGARAPRPPYHYQSRPDHTRTSVWYVLLTCSRAWL